MAGCSRMAQARRSGPIGIALQFSANAFEHADNTTMMAAMILVDAISFSTLIRSIVSQATWARQAALPRARLRLDSNHPASMKQSNKVRLPKSALFRRCGGVGCSLVEHRPTSLAEAGLLPPQA